jgi:hypothetical protein
MTIEEFADNSKKHSDINPEYYAKIEPLYIVLDIDKDKFAALVDAAGLETLAAKAGRWERLLKAEEELAEKEKYIAAKDEFEVNSRRQEYLNDYIKNYERNIRVYC